MNQNPWCHNVVLLHLGLESLSGVFVICSLSPPVVLTLPEPPKNPIPPLSGKGFVPMMVCSWRMLWNKNMQNLRQCVMTLTTV